MKRPTPSHIDLADRIAKAALKARVVVHKFKNDRANEGVTPTLALAVALEREGGQTLSTSTEIIFGGIRLAPGTYIVRRINEEPNRDPPF